MILVVFVLVVLSSVFVLLVLLLVDFVGQIVLLDVDLVNLLDALKYEVLLVFVCDFDLAQEFRGDVF